MLSYRHAFHAGNHADVLKHFLLYCVLDYYNQKDKPYWYIDTHSGAGVYDLQGSEAQKVGEFADGIGRLVQAALPDTLASFVRHLRGYLPNPNLYGGSPWLAQSLLREADKLRLFELHPADFQHLQHNMREAKLGRRGILKQEDGFAGLIALLPPVTRRAVVLIDPPYEQKQGYTQVAHTLKDALKRFEQGCYMVWYPCLSRPESLQLPEKLKKLHSGRTSRPHPKPGRLRHARQRHVSHQSALHAARHPAQHPARPARYFAAGRRRAFCVGLQNPLKNKIKSSLHLTV